jgi:uncharacterized membrane protein YagU involved in acid resistance
MRRISAAKAILIGGSIAGACDILYAIVYSWLARGTPPVRILQSVASGLLGKPAFDGGWPVAALGLFLHFFIALSAAVIFYFVARKIPALVRHAVLSGVLYGFLIFWFMRLVVLPLSAFPFPVRFPLGPSLLEMLFHMFTVGLPIALAVRMAVVPRSIDQTFPK